MNKTLHHVLYQLINIHVHFVYINGLNVRMINDNN